MRMEPSLVSNSSLIAPIPPMHDLIRQYYLGERAIAQPAFIVAGAVLLIALLCLKNAANPVAKGMGTGLLIVCALLVTVGVSAMIYNGKKLETLPEPTTTTEAALQQTELDRMDKVMNVTFRSAFITFTVLMLAAMLVILLTKNDYWRGMAIALMILVALATIGDSFNARRCGLYLEAVKAYEVR